MPAKKWTKERIISWIVNNSEHGIAPICSNEIAGLAKAARREFGGWEEACRAAGIRSRSEAGRREQKKWTRNKIIAQIKALSDGSVAPKSVDDYRLYMAALRLFESWEEACKKAGVRPQVLKNHTDWTKEKVVKRIREKSQDRVAPPTYDNPNLYDAARRYFGSWSEACRLADKHTRSSQRTETM